MFSTFYPDLLEFETDLAQIVDLIVLFCESEGSLAELGAFSVIEEISQRLLVVVRDRHYSLDSFIKLGPLAAIERKHGASAVYVVDDSDINMNGKSAAGIKLNVLRDRLQKPLHERLKSARAPTTFDKNRSGHLIKLMVAMIQEYGALTKNEIFSLFLKLKLPTTIERIAAFGLCAE